MENSGKLIGALLLGAAVGVGLGILLAPDKGTETRKKLLNNSKDLADELREKFRDGINKLRDMEEISDEKVDDFIRTVKSKMDHTYKPKTDVA